MVAVCNTLYSSMRTPGKPTTHQSLSILRGFPQAQLASDRCPMRDVIAKQCLPQAMRGSVMKHGLALGSHPTIE